MTVRKSHPFIRFIYNRLREEHLAWRIMFREEWVSLLVVLGSVLLVVFFTRPLPPREVTLAVGQPGSTTEQLGRRYQEIFAQEGVTLTLINTAGSHESIAEADDTKTPVNAGFLLGALRIVVTILIWYRLAVCNIYHSGSFIEVRNLRGLMPSVIFGVSQLRLVVREAGPNYC